MREDIRSAMRSAAALSCSLGVLFALARPAWLRSDLDPSTGLPRDAAGRAELLRQMAELRAQRSAQGGPKLMLPPEQRAGWIAAWNKLRACTRAHGFEGVSAVEPSYGDGDTPAPMIAGSGALATQALEACPFDTSLFDHEQVAAAIKAQLSAAEPSSSSVIQRASDLAGPDRARADNERLLQAN